MSTEKFKLISFSVKVAKIQFEPSDCILGKISMDIEFLNNREDTIFQPICRPTSNVLKINAGKLFTFGLNRDMELCLSKEFVINVYLQQIDPDKLLSKARVDVTKQFREILKDPCSNNSKV